jgi:hypothetical protein
LYKYAKRLGVEEKLRIYAEVLLWIIPKDLKVK